MPNDIQLLTKEIQKIIDYSLLGKKSPVAVMGTDAVTIKDGFMIHFLEETVVEEISYDNNSSDDTADPLNTQTFLGGDKVFLKGITSIHLTSGACLVYEAK